MPATSKDQEKSVYKKTQPLGDKLEGRMTVKCPKPWHLNNQLSKESVIAYKGT